MPQSKAYGIKSANRNLKAACASASPTMPAWTAQQQRLKRIATLRVLEMVAYRKFDRQ